MGNNDSPMLPEQHSHIVRFTMTHVEFSVIFEGAGHAKTLVIVDP